MRLRPNLSLAALAMSTAAQIRPDILWDFTNPAAPLPGFSLTRATTGTFVAQDGSIQTAAINAPRYDWTGGVRALLVEPSATNLNTRALTGGTITGWTLWPASASAFVSATSSPDLQTNGVRIGAISDGGGLFGPNASFVAGTKYYISALIRSFSGDPVIRLFVANSLAVGGAGSQSIEFNASNGAVISVSPLITDATVSPSYGGYWRVSGSFTCTSSVSVGCAAIYAKTAGSVFDAFGVQLEVSALTSLIPTAGAAVTRATDSLASLAMSAIWAAAGSVQGTVVADVEARAPNSTSIGYMWSIVDTGLNRLALRAYMTGLTDDRLTMIAGDGSANFTLSIANALRGRQKIAVSYANGAQPMVSRNGDAAQVHPLVYAHNPANTALQNLFAGFNGRVRSLAVYRNAVNAAQLAAMSAVA